MKSSKHLAFLSGLLACTMPLEAASTLQFGSTVYTIAENAGTVALSVRRTDDVDTVVQVDYASADGTALAGKKYLAVAGTLDFAAGETNKMVVVSILNESLVEGLQTFQVILSNPAGGALLGLRTNATVRITDNDTGLQFEFASYSVSEDAGPVLIGVVRGDDGDFSVTVDYATADGTATAGSDYTQTSGTFSFAAGEKGKLFTVPIVNDSRNEANKTFKLTLTNPAGGGVLGLHKAVTVTIVDNDPGVQFESNQYFIQENEGALTVKVFRGNDVDLTHFTVDYATTNLTAKAGQDYVETSGTLAFAAGETVKTITIPTLTDELQRADAKFRLTLSNPTGRSVLGTNRSATITILDATGSSPHRFDGIGVLPDGNIRLTVGGSVSTRFRPYFDLYPIEVSTNLVDWIPFVTLQRTNSFTNAFTYTQSEAAHSDRRFYRTVTNQFITPLPKPTGPYAVGVVSRLLTDSTRRNRYGISTNSSFLVSFWYPAQARPGVFPASFDVPQFFSQWDEQAGQTGFGERVRSFVSHSYLEAPVATNSGLFPILVFSPGANSRANYHSDRFEDLASHGYMVLAIDHSAAGGVIFDGKLLYAPSFDAGNPAEANPVLADRVEDFRFVLDDLPRLNDTDPILAGRMDLERIGTFGFSFGAGVAAEFCRIDVRCKAVAVLEGYLQGADQLRTFGVGKPVLSLYVENGDNALFNKATADAVWVGIKNTEHADFSALFLVTEPGISRREPPLIQRTYLLSFFNKYLKNNDDHFMDSPPAVFPRVTGFVRK